MKITTDDVERHGDLLLVQVKETKTGIDRSFTITGVFRNMVEQYAALRSQKTDTNRFFCKLHEWEVYRSADWEE